MNSPLGNQMAEIPLIYGPLPFLFLECLKDFFGGGQIGPVDIIYAADRLQKIRQVLTPGKARQLRAVVQPKVEYPPDPRIHDHGEDMLGRLLGKSDCENADL